MTIACVAQTVADLNTDQVWIGESRVGEVTKVTFIAFTCIYLPYPLIQGDLAMPSCCDVNQTILNS